MHTSHQAKLLEAGFTIYTGNLNSTTGKLTIKAKTAANHNWHTIENDFKTAAALKRRLARLDHEPKWIDLYDSKNSPFSFGKPQ